MKRLYVIGSSNTDMVVKTQRFPEPGETLLGGDFFMFPGGKGANQAVAAARAGGDVHFICAVGDDVFGTNAMHGYIREGMDVSQTLIIPKKASGVALITVNGDGENEIVVASGTNALLGADHVEQALRDHQEPAMVLTQLETPMDTVAHLAGLCRSKAWPLIINPAPAQLLNREILEHLFLITPNETEAQLLTGITVNDEKSAAEAARVFMEKGVHHVIITMGSKGSFFKSAEDSFFVPAQKVQAVDTTAAGDVFNGVLAVCLAEGLPWKDGMVRATKAAALSVTKMGAQDTAPYKQEFT